MKRRALYAFAIAPTLLGCTGEEPELLATLDAQQPNAVGGPVSRLRAPLLTRPWVSDFRLGAALDPSVRLVQVSDELAPGDPVYLSMQVNEVPPWTVVSTYWYGPNNLALGHDTQSVSSGQGRLRFVRHDTSSWMPGAYRAEVWIAADRIQVRHFDILAR
jgi:hypothetical protein